MYFFFAYFGCTSEKGGGMLSRKLPYHFREAGPHLLHIPEPWFLWEELGERLVMVWSYNQTPYKRTLISTWAEHNTKQSIFLLTVCHALSGFKLKAVDFL